MRRKQVKLTLRDLVFTCYYLEENSPIESGPGHPEIIPF
jgi:hypothetical protein